MENNLIDRQDAIDALRNPCKTCTFIHPEGCSACQYADLIEIINALPSAQVDIAEKLYQCKCYITDQEGLQHEVIYVDDIRRVTGWEI